METKNSLTINGTVYHVPPSPDQSLLGILRDELGLTGTKYGCGEGQCGACTVLADGIPIRSCRTSLRSVIGKKITTIEGLSANGKLHPLQQAFLEEDALQCGYCTPGMILSGVGLLHQNPNPTPEDIIRFMNGNICRCGTYKRIIKAITQAAQQLREGRK